MRVEGDLREREKGVVAWLSAKWSRSLESAPSTDSIAPHRHSLQLSYCSLRDPEAGRRESSAGGLLSSLVPNCVSVFPSFRGKAPAASFWPSPRHRRPLLAISPPSLDQVLSVVHHAASAAGIGFFCASSFWEKCRSRDRDKGKCRLLSPSFIRILCTRILFCHSSFMFVAQVRNVSEANHLFSLSRTS